MSGRVWVVCGLMLLGSMASGEIFTVTRKADAGSNTLRWAIKQANGNTNKSTIEFAPKMMGKTIILDSELPPIKKELIIDGDINDDGAPDVMINGINIGSDRGLVVRDDGSAIIGLAIGNFDICGIYLDHVAYCTVHSCHLGLNLAGLASRPNQTDIRIDGGGHHQIGGSSHAQRNVIGARVYGVYVEGSSDNVIAGNTFGVNRDGAAKLGVNNMGVALIESPTSPCERNVVGGNQAGERNVFAGLQFGVSVWRADDCKVSGNTFGLGSDGDTELGMGFAGVLVRSPSDNNTIGGTTLGHRNVFAGGKGGVVIAEPLIGVNRVQGNYFGTNLDGTKQRTLTFGVKIETSAGRQIIGGSPAACNYFALDSSEKMYGVWLHQAGHKSLISHNRFGFRPDGAQGPNYDTAIYVHMVGCEARDNVINNASIGINCIQTPNFMQAYGNDIKRCNAAVDVAPTSLCRLGDLGNASTADDGRNKFRSTNAWFVRNDSANRIPAEGNSWGTTVKSEINAKIEDRRDNPALGVVDFDPLAGGISPSGGTLAIAGARAVGTRGGGVEVTFSLLAAARVSATVVNVAGRPVATVLSSRPLEAGMRRVLWSGMSDAGLAAPRGSYIVRIDAYDEAGQTATALAPVRVVR